MDSKELGALSRGLRFLSVGNPKTLKGNGAGYLTGILHLAPANESGNNVCPFATPECASACLNTSGRGAMQRTQDARIRKTRAFFDDRATFLKELHGDIWLVVNIAGHYKMTPAIRLNGTSDIPWERHGVPQAWPHVVFYDYTKWPARRDLPANYHLTFSFSGHNLAECEAALAAGMNVAVPFRVAPATWLGYPVVDGDQDDLRFLNKGPCIIALKPKGRLRSQINSPFLGDNHHGV